MQYKGHELVEVTEPQIYEQPKQMLVWNDGYLDCYKMTVIAITKHGTFVLLRDRDAKVYDHCAEIPEEPKHRRATNRELAKWLSQGNGEFTLVSDKNQLWSTSFFGGRGYEHAHEDDPVDGKMRVRKWDDTDWHEPTVDYIGLEG